jgi:hypothetical protein
MLTSRSVPQQTEQIFSPLAGQNLFTLRLLQIGQVNERSLGRAQLPLRQKSYYAIVPAASSSLSTFRLGSPSITRAPHASPRSHEGSQPTLPLVHLQGWLSPWRIRAPQT